MSLSSKTAGRYASEILMRRKTRVGAVPTLCSRNITILSGRMNPRVRSIGGAFSASRYDLLPLQHREFHRNDRGRSSGSEDSKSSIFRSFSSAPPQIRSRDATSAWLAAGGDGRVTLHDEEHSATAAFNEDDDVGSGRTTTVVTSGINAYGTSTHPRPEVIERSSCTSSSPRMEAFAHVDEIRAGIADSKDGGLDVSHLTVQPTIGNDSSQWPVEATLSVSEIVESNRSRLLNVLGLEPMTGSDTDESGSCAAVMCASGTDAELIGALAGIAAAGTSSETVQKWTASNKGEGLAVTKGGASLVSILMPGTGSGVGDAAGMRHHSAAAPQADSVQPGEPISGMVDGSIVAFEPVQENVDVTDGDALREYIDAKKEQTNASSVLLHAIAGSKTGMHQPPLVVADSLVSEDVLVCIDACQMRVTPEYIRSQLSKGYIVLLTGSKFYGGPPFAGAVLLPPKRAREIEELAALEGGIPSGLAEYFTADDVPGDSMPLLKSKLPPIPNTGLALRWTAALHSMERFRSAPSFMTNRVAKRWVSRVRALAEGFYPAVEVLEAHGIDEEEEHRIGGVNTIVSLMIRTGGSGGGMLGVKGLKQLQLLLGTDLSDLCDGTTFPESARGVAEIRAQLGQPVLLGGGALHGVVRLAVGATDICEAVESSIAMQEASSISSEEADPFAALDALSDAIDAMVVNDVQVLRKIELLATHWEAVAKRFDELPATAVRWQARLAAEGVASAQTSKHAPREVTHVDIGWLKPHEKVVNQDRVTALVDAIGRWGAYRKPLLVDRDSGSILDGHHRYFAAQKLGLAKVPAALVDYLEDDSISVELWPGDHGVTSISKQDVIDMCLSADVFPPKTSRHTFAEPLNPIFVPLEELRDDGATRN